MTNRTDQRSPTTRAAAPTGADAATRKRSLGASFPIVGIGASAGGLEAFTQLLKALPPDTGMGFVLVQHLDPDHESALTHILSRATKLPVREVTNNQAVQANHVYVIPPDTNLAIDHGVLKLAPRPRTRKPHKPIDGFFESLAADQYDRAIGVVLSGTANDGTLGLEAIKAEGGITFAQDDSAKHDSMPRSAVAAGCVDLVLSPADIARELARIARHPSVAGRPLALSTRGETDRAEATAHEDDDTPLPSGGPARGGKETPRTPAKKTSAGKRPAKRAASRSAQVEEDGYKKILLLLRNHSGVDFSLYKSTTIQRRIHRRLVLAKQDTLSDYARFVRGNAKELDALYSDVLISVTSFFRNPEMFDVLQRKVLPALLKQRGDDPLRVWVLGCSTGQEAYSIAMSFVEAAERAPRMRRLQVFATDLNDTLLEKARHGLYAKSLAEDISPQRLTRFFTEEAGGYRVNKALREMVVFARQNLIADPPFSRMDVISCRNLLIYLEPSLQQKALPTFHYALKPEGFLLLGASESIGGFTDLFEPLDRKHKIYTRKPAPTPAFHLPVKVGHGARSRPSAPPTMQTEAQPEAPDLRGELSAQREADRIAINQFAPPSVLVNAELQVLQFRGPTGAYLQPPAGKASFDVLKMARDGLMLPLRAAINRARRENKTVRRDNVRVQQNGTSRSVNLEVIPLKNLRERCFLIVFEKPEKSAARSSRAQKAAARTGKAAPVTAKAELRRSAELQTELTETRQYLQSMQEQHEAVNEELQAANEEVQSANEELQSINEELETSKEELESANEELITVNEEMANRNVELNRLNNDMVNLQSSTKQCVVLLARDLTIRRFSAQAEKQFELRATDVGRPISHIRHHFVVAVDGVQSADTPLDLESISAEVIASVREQEREVHDRAGRWHSLRVRPYMTLDNKVDGAVLVLVDINGLKHSELLISAARDIAENTVETVREPLLVLDKELRVGHANRSFYRAFGVTPKETVGKFIYDLGNRQWDIPRLRELLEEILPQSTTVEDFSVEHDFEHLGHRMMLLNARRIVDPQRKSERILLAIEDITDRTRAAQTAAHLAAIVTSSEDAIISKDLDGVITTWNQGAQHLFGYTAEEAIGQPVTLLIPEDHLDEEPRILERVRRGEAIDHYETVRRRKDGSLIDISLTVSPMRDAAGNVAGASKIARDITGRRQAEQALRASEAATRRAAEELKAHYQNSPVGMLQLDRELRYVRINDAMARMNGIPAADHIGRTVRQIVPHLADKIEPAFRRILQTGEPVLNVEVTGETAAEPGVQRAWLESWVAVRDSDGQITGLTVTAQDITDRKRAEQALGESEERFRTLADNMAQFAWTADAKGSVYWYNRRWYDYTGTSFDELQGWGWKKVHHPDHVDRVIERLQHSWDTGEEWEDTFPLRGKDGSYRWFLSRALPIRDAQGNVMRWFGTNTDVTEQREMADALRQQAADMSEADRHKNEFLAMLAHELRNPLAPIRNALQIMRLTGSKPAAVGSASTILERQVGQMVRLVDDLLDMSRITRGKIELRKSPVELASVVHHAVEAARPLADSLEHQITVTLPPEPVFLDADPTRLTQVVGNLLNNASKFSRKSSRIWLNIEQDGAHAVIRVRDEGIGITADQLPRIFDMFMQADTSLERSTSGLGIGLTLVKSLVEMHGGTVEVKSEGIGRGSEFMVRLPMLLEAPAAAAEQISVASAIASHCRILVVDDNRDAAESLVTLLTLTGNEMRAAYDGLEAIEAAAAFRPDVVLLDIGLPKLNGYEVARRIRQQPRGKDMVLVALTGWGQDGDREKSKEAGFDAHLTKPVDPVALQQVLAQLGQC